MIKHWMVAAALVVMAAPAGAQLSISVGEPGFYGQLNIGGAPAPQYIYPQPIVVERGPGYVAGPPMYLRVPPGYEKHWGKHCAQYGACGRPVYFVRNDWYLNRYVPYYRGRHAGPGDRGDRGERHFRHEREHGHGDRGRGHGDQGDQGNHGRGHGHHD